MNTATRLDRLAEAIERLTEMVVPQVVMVHAPVGGYEGDATRPAQLDVGDIELTADQQAAVDQGATIAIFEAVP